MFSRFKSFIFFTFIFILGISAGFAQEKPENKEKTDTKPVPIDAKNLTAEQLAESAILVYGGLRGREGLNQIRKSTFERGRITLTNAEGKSERINYERWILRSAEGLDKERVRFNQEFPDARFALVYSGDKIFGLYNDSVFTPREDASKAFENQIWHGIEALLRYKENGATLALAKREKIMNVDLYALDVTDKQNRKTRYYISAKSFRVMMLEYTEGGVNYKQKFYDYNYAQGTLVPYRSVLWANDKEIEEVQIQTISFGQKIDEALFSQEG